MLFKMVLLTKELREFYRQFIAIRRHRYGVDPERYEVLVSCLQQFSIISKYNDNMFDNIYDNLFDNFIDSFLDWGCDIITCPLK